MISPLKMLDVLTTIFILIDSSSAASSYRRKPDATTYKVTVPSSPTADQYPSRDLMARSQASTYKTFSTRESPSRLKQFHQSDVSVSTNPGAPLVPQRNDTVIADPVNNSAAHEPPNWPAWLPTLGTILNSVVHVIIMILGVLNISINPRVHGERHAIKFG